MNKELEELSLKDLYNHYQIKDLQISFKIKTLSFLTHEEYMKTFRRYYGYPATSAGIEPEFKNYYTRKIKI